jgi:hypothetical protein
MAIIPLGAWTPDQPDVQGPNLTVARGVYARKRGYSPFPGLTESSAALEGACLGAYAARDIDQAAHMFAGTDTKLYELIGVTWTDRSKVGGYGPSSDSTRWRFTAYGDRQIATNGIDNPQYFDMSSGGSAFADLPNAPVALYCAVLGPFLVFLSTAGNSMRVVWSGFEDSEGYTAGVNQSDFQDLTDGGRITGAVPTQNALFIFQEKCVRRMLYVGGDLIMQIDKLFDGIGCIEPNSLVAYGQIMFFLDESGWMMFDGASQPQSIGDEVFDEWFLADSTRAYWYSMSAAIDPGKKIAAWAYASTGSGSGMPDAILLYNYQVGKASYVRLNTEFLFPGASLGVSFDDLTSTDVDTMTVSSDDPIFLGGTFYFGAFSTAHKSGSFSGDNVEATLETGLAQLADGRRAVVEWVRPITDAESVTVAVGAVVKASGALTFNSAVSQQTSGRCPQRDANGFFHALKIVVPASEDWTYVDGFELSARQAGVR